jgi:hypothetical protein
MLRTYLYLALPNYPKFSLHYFPFPLQLPQFAHGRIEGVVQSQGKSVMANGMIPSSLPCPQCFATRVSEFRNSEAGKAVAAGPTHLHVEDPAVLVAGKGGQCGVDWWTRARTEFSAAFQHIEALKLINKISQ